MKRTYGIYAATALAGGCLLFAGAKPLRATGGPAAPIGYAQERGWDVPPGELDEVSRRGFHDGVEGARKDYGNHRPPNVHNREEFRHPSVPHRDREAYRHGFERGYQAGVEHLEHWQDRDRDHDHDRDPH